MCVTLFRTHSRARHTTNTIQRIRNGHYFHFVIVVVEIIIVLDDITAIDQLEHIARAHLVTAAATNTFLAVQLGDIFGYPFVTPRNLKTVRKPYFVRVSCGLIWHVGW